MKVIDNLKAEILALFENPAKHKRAAAIFDRYAPRDKRAQERERQISRAVAWLDAMPRAECARTLVAFFRISPRTAYSRIRVALDQRAKLRNNFRPTCTTGR